MGGLTDLDRGQQNQHTAGELGILPLYYLTDLLFDLSVACDEFVNEKKLFGDMEEQFFMKYDFLYNQ